MTSTLKLSENEEAKDAVSSEPAKKPLDQGSDWESLRGLTTNVHQKQPSTGLRTALLAVLLVVGLASLGLVLHNYMPALVSFGGELSKTVYRIASHPPTPSRATPGPELPDLRHPHSKRRASSAPHASAPDFPPAEAYDPAFHPFYATTIIGGQRISLRSNNRIVILDLDSGTWNFASEME